MQYLTFKSDTVSEFLRINAHGEFRSILSNHGISLNGDKVRVRLFNNHEVVPIMTEVGIEFGNISPEGVMYTIIMVTKEDIANGDVISKLEDFNLLTFEEYNQFSNRFYLKYKIVDSKDTDQKFVIHTEGEDSVCVDIDFDRVEETILDSLHEWYNDFQLSKVRSVDCKKTFGIRMNENLRRMGASENVIFSYWKYITDKSKLNSIDFYNIVTDSEFTNKTPEQLTEFLCNTVGVENCVIEDLLEVKNYLY